jgi:hypothetical protein
MPKNHFPRAGGNQWVDSFYHVSQGTRPTTGNEFYVNSVTGTDSTGYGYSPEAPFASIAYAVGTAATANNGDVVYGMPGHTEVITTAAGVAMSKAGVRLEGLGDGRQRPTITYTTNVNASFDITAAGCMVNNIVFTMVGVDAITAGINVTAAGVRIANCEIETGNATNQATLALLTNNSANRLIIEDCHWHGSTDAGTTSAITLVGGSDCIVRRNAILGSYTTTTGGIQNITTASINLLLDSNWINNMTASSTKAITAVAGTTGLICNNRMAIGTGTAPITSAGAFWVSNYYANTAATLSVLL